MDNMIFSEIFKKKSKNFLGVDLGAGGVKVVEFGVKDKRTRLLTYGYTENYFFGEEGVVEYLDHPKISELLAEVCKRARVSSREAITSLPLNKVTNSIVTVSAVTDAELKSVAEVEAAKLIDYPIAEAVVDFRVLKEEEQEVVKGGRAKLKVKKVLLTITRRDIIGKYVDIFKKAGLILKTLETESFALARCLVGKDRAAVGIVDIGAARTSVLLVDSSVPVLSRSIAVGGINLSKILANIMGLDLESAEETKKDVSRLGVFTEEMPQPIKDLLAPVTSEARYLFDIFSKDENRKVEKIILTGGSSFFPKLCDYFTKELGVKTFIGDPWARVVYHEDLKSILQELGPRFAVAIGLAMREIE